MSVDEVTEWIIKNKLKVEFKDSYDEAIKENAVIYTAIDAVQYFAIAVQCSRYCGSRKVCWR